MKRYSYSLLFALCSLIGILATSCSKDEYYGEQPMAYVNFYNAAEVLQQYWHVGSGPNMRDNMVYINDSVPTGAFSNGNFPVFGGTAAVTTTQRQYPNEVTSTPTGSAVLLPNTYQYMFYMALAPDSYRFIYTGGNKVYWQDTTLNLADGSYTQLYLTEDAEIDRYRIVAVPDERTAAPPGKVKVRVVHLSADTEPLAITRVFSDGSNRNEGFPTQLGFATSTDYIALDTLGAAAQFNHVVLQLSPVSAPENPLLTAAVPAVSGGSFTVLVVGLRNEASRRAITGYDDTGQPVYTSFTVNANLRTALRRNY